MTQSRYLRKNPNQFPITILATTTIRWPNPPMQPTPLRVEQDRGDFERQNLLH